MYQSKEDVILIVDSGATKADWCLVSGKEITHKLKCN